MTSLAARVRGRITIANAVGLVAVCAAMLASVVDRRSPANELVFLSISIALPLHLLVNLRRTRSITELAAAAVAMAYLAWGALLEFRPGILPVSWAVFDATHWMYWFVGHWLGQRPPPHPHTVLDAMRWNWGFLSAFYVAILIRGAVPLFRKRPLRVGIGGQSPQTAVSGLSRAWLAIPPAAELVVALWFITDWLPCLRYFGLMKCGWLGPAGFTASLALAMANWRPRPPNWRLSRFAVRVAGLVPASTAGVMTGLAWSLWGWKSSVLIAVSLLVLIVLRALLPFPRRRRCILADLLAMFWGFAISAEIAEMPGPVART